MPPEIARLDQLHPCTGSSKNTVQIRRRVSKKNEGESRKRFTPSVSTKSTVRQGAQNLNLQGIRLTLAWLNGHMCRMALA